MIALVAKKKNVLLSVFAAKEILPSLKSRLSWFALDQWQQIAKQHVWHYLKYLRRERVKELVGSYNSLDALIFFSSGMSLRKTDLAEIDKDYVPGLMCIRDMEREAFEAIMMEMPFSTPSASGQEVPLHNKIRRITLDNREEYVRLALHYRLHEFDTQVYSWSIPWSLIAHRLKLQHGPLHSGQFFCKDCHQFRGTSARDNFSLPNGVKPYQKDKFLSGVKTDNFFFIALAIIK